MNQQKLSRQVMGAMLTVLLLVGCGAAATPTPVPPTATPSRAFTLAASAGEIGGTWQRGRVEGALYIRFDEDGTFREAYALNELDSQPFSINSYQFEGTKLVTTQVSVSGVPSCGESIGSYEIRLLESGNIRIVAIEDPCTHRAGSVAGEYEPVR